MIFGLTVLHQECKVATPAVLTAEIPPKLLAALPPDGVIVVPTPDPLVLQELPALETEYVLHQT